MQMHFFLDAFAFPSIVSFSRIARHHKRASTMKTIKIHSSWNTNITIDVSKADSFACDAIAKFFTFAAEDMGDYFRITAVPPKQARAFVEYCAE